MDTRVLEQLGDHAAAWDRLVDAMPLPSPFLRSWWLAAVAQGDPRFVLVFDREPRDGDPVGGDRLLGGLALQQTHRAGVEWLEFLGSGPLQPDHLDLVCATDRADDVGAALRAWLGRPGNRVIDLMGARSGARLLDVVPGVGEVTPLEIAPYVTLPPTSAVARR